MSQPGASDQLFGLRSSRRASYVILGDKDILNGMTSPRKISIYVPEDLVPVLDEVENASAYIADSIRMRRRHEATRAMLRESGYLVSDAGVQRMRERVRALDAQNAEAIAAGEE